MVAWQFDITGFFRGMELMMTSNTIHLKQSVEKYLVMIILESEAHGTATH